MSQKPHKATEARQRAWKYHRQFTWTMTRTVQHTHLAWKRSRQGVTTFQALCLPHISSRYPMQVKTCNISIPARTEVRGWPFIVTP